jgi:ADP-ribose pyrophosphatase YjhB (NUDIX family)
MITNFKKYTMNENLNNFDMTKLVTIIAINKDEEGNWIYITKENNELILPKEKAGVISLVDDKLANFVNTGHPINKYFETEHDNNVITYAANFAADAVPFNEGRVYLIERKDDRGWALPGGFIDPGETPEHAALRELGEETLAKEKDIKSVESLGIFRANDPREINFFTHAYLIHIKSTAELKFADDAKNGKWVLLNRAVNHDLAFPHHNDILKAVSY